VNKLKVDYNISDKSWNEILMMLVQYLLLVDLFPVPTGNQETDIITQIIWKVGLGAADKFGEIYRSV
jgi:hypothetical protein